MLSAFEAGADILLICEDQDLVLESMGALRSEVHREEWAGRRLRESAERILHLKTRFLLPFEGISLNAVREYFKVI